MKKKTVIFSIFCLLAVVFANFFSVMPTFQTYAEDRLIGVIDGIQGKEIISHKLTGYQGYSPYHYFGNNLNNVDFSQNITYLDKNGNQTSEYRALTNTNGTFFSEGYGSGFANIALIGEMQTLAETGHYYAFASAGLLAGKNQNNSMLEITLSCGDKSSSATSNKVYSSGVLSPEWVNTDKLFLSSKLDNLTFSFSTLDKYSIWNKAEFYLFEPEVFFGIVVDKIDNITESKTVSKGSLISLDASTFLSDLEGLNLIRYYQLIHKIEWEIVSGSEYGEIIDGYLQVGQNAGKISVRAKCLKDTYGSEYVYGDVITFNIDASTITLSSETNFKDGVTVSGLSDTYTPNRYATVFVDIKEGYSLINFTDELGNELTYNITSSGLYRIRIYLENSSKIIKINLKRTLTLDNIIIKDKYYDKTKNAEIEKIVFKEGDLGHGVSVDESLLTATFSDVIPGDNIPVTITGEINLIGENAYMYEIVGKITLTSGNILKRSIEVVAHNIEVEYGENIPKLSYNLNGSLLEGDFLSGELAVVTSGEIGEYKITIGTLGNSYYDIDFTYGTLKITARKIEIIDIFADSKTYDGTKVLSSEKLRYSINGSFLSSHNVALNSNSEFEDKNVGDNLKLTISFSLSGQDAKYYNLVQNKFETYSSITPKTLNVTALDNEKIYGESDPDIKFTYDKSQLISGDTISGNLQRSLGEGVGEYTITIGTLNAPNYNIVLKKGVFTIKQRELQIQIDNISKIYGDKDPTLTYNITSGSIVNNDNLNIELTRTSGETVGNYSILLNYSNVNYQINYVASTFTIKKRDAVVKIAPINKIYDGSLNCNFDCSLENVLISDNVTFNGLAKFINKNVGIWEVEYFTLSDNKILSFSSNYLSGNNLNCYNFIFEIGYSAEISRRDLGVNLSEKYLSKIYGETDLGFPITFANLVEGDVIVGNLSREEGEDAGIYNILTNDLNNENNKNYNISFNFNLKFEIVKRNLSIVVDDKQLEFGEEEGEIVYYLSSETPLPNGVILSEIVEGMPTRELGSNIGDYAYLIGSLKIKDEHQINYNLNFVGGTLTIYSKNLIIKVKDCTKIYGSSDPKFEYEIVGTPYIKLNITFSRNIGENVGSYEILANLNDNNYNAQILNGLLTIEPAKVTIKLNSTIKTYGEVDPEFNINLKDGDLKFNDKLTDVFSGSFVREQGENVGTYIIDANNISVNSNYDVDFEIGNFVIIPKNLYIEAKQINKFYKDAEPELTYTAIGLLNGDVINGELERESGEEVGEYKISIGTLNASNYNIVFTESTFVISKRKLVINILPTTKVYDGEEYCELNYELEGDLIENNMPIINLFKETGKDVGKYLISTNFQDELYDVEIVENYVEILKRKIQINVDSHTISYGSEIPDLTYVVINDIENSELAVSTYRNQSNMAGRYTIYATVLNDKNYDIEINEGLLIIEKITIEVEISNYSKIYGTSDPIFEYKIISGEVLENDVLSGVITREEGEKVGEYKIICALENQNYTIIANEAIFEIVPKDLNLVTSIKDKVYDGTEIAYIRVPVLLGIINGDDVYFVFEEDKVARFASSEVASDIDVIVYGGAIEGEDADNYKLVYPTGLKASITHDKLQTQVGDKEVEIIANANNTSLIAGANVDIQEYNKDSLEKDFGSSKKIVDAFNFKIENNGKVIEQTGKITLNLDTLNKELNNVQVFRLNSDGTKTLINSSYSNGSVSFETEQTGTYIIVADNDFWLDIILICSGALVLLIVIVIIISKNRKKLKKK